MSLKLKGLAASGGVVEGIVKVVYGPEDTPHFPEGAILVAPMTEPSMVMMMNKAAGIITDRGGMASHPAILSRELGIPGVVATKEATKLLKDGMTIRLDGDAGEIVVLKDAP